ncbi:PREDICTED: uncharacterized protein LOC109479701 [Branchiostoma belcheri]|uniref:Uncharacterized protein LOC109479701 n=1 Tax=Branchiostoma belcheri TaxID=7741 RepID=A0A6P4Z770_BRABE|nr:PREDICTED: uncharacterized protein LOC109479701 [Branchiostoma belcheri]
MQLFAYASSVFVVISWTSLEQLLGATAAPTGSPRYTHGIQPFSGQPSPTDAAIQGETNIASSWQSFIGDPLTNDLDGTTTATTHANLEADATDKVQLEMEETVTIEPTGLPDDANMEGDGPEDAILPTDAWTKATVKSNEEATEEFGFSKKAMSISDAEDSLGSKTTHMSSPKRSWSNNVTSPGLMIIGSSMQEAARGSELDTTNGPKLIPKLLIMRSTLQPSVDTNFTADDANTHVSSEPTKAAKDSTNIPRPVEENPTDITENTQEYHRLESSLSERASRSNISAAAVDIEEGSRLLDFINVTEAVSLPQMSGLSSGAGENDHSTYTSHGSMCKSSSTAACQNNGTCTTGNGGLACTCTALYRGRFCQESKLKLAVGETIGTSATVHWSTVDVNDTVVTSLYFSDGSRWDHISTSTRNSFTFNGLQPRQHYNQGVQSLFLCTHLSDETQALYVSPEKRPLKTYSPDFLVRLTSVLNFEDST